MTSEGLTVEAIDALPLYEKATEMADRQPKGRIMLSDTPLTGMFDRERTYLSVVADPNEEDKYPTGIVLSAELFLSKAFQRSTIGGFFNGTQIRTLIEALQQPQKFPLVRLEEDRKDEDKYTWRLYMYPTGESTAILDLGYSSREIMQAKYPSLLRGDNRYQVQPDVLAKIAAGYPNDNYILRHEIPTIDGISPLRDERYFAKAMDMHAWVYGTIIKAIHEVLVLPKPKGEILFSAKKAV